MRVGAHESTAGGLHRALVRGEEDGCEAVQDSMAEVGSRRDRHAHIGEGTLGLAPFVSLVNDPRFADHPGVVETPPEIDGTCSFSRNIRKLKSLRGRCATEGRGGGPPH